jgi:glutamine---fructose-6-phosphate transaminase (isomerizing)
MLDQVDFVVEFLRIKMCGIVGYFGNKNALDVILNGLERLEYRGYDSAGIALRNNTGNKSSIMIKKALGKLNTLKELVTNINITSNSGIGHTRWATHGAPSFDNAHPHQYGRVSLVHNGILENHQTIKQKLIKNGHKFYSHTDSEVAAHLLDSYLKQYEPLQALIMLCDTIQGSYAFGIMIENDHEKIYFAKNGSPLLIAKGQGEYFFASDQTALIDYQPEYYALKDLEMGFISENLIKIFDIKGQQQSIKWNPLLAKKECVQKLGHKYFMHKEIFEQPTTVDKVLSGRLFSNGINLSGFDLNFDKILKAEKIQIIACGSAYYAGLIAKPQMEAIIRLPVIVEVASEYRYRDTLTDNKTLVIAVSQSGETLDTLSALEKALSLDAMVMSVCNVLGSAIANKCENSIGNLFLNAGPEISVASTKAFIGQVIALKLFTLALAKAFGRSCHGLDKNLLQEFDLLKKNIEGILSQDEQIRSLAKMLINEPRMLYLGRGEFFPVALEGALKMKELSYIFAEGYPAGELKHGPIATIDPKMPAIVIFGSDSKSVKTNSNLQEIKARGAKIISIAPKSFYGLKEESDFLIEYGKGAPFFDAILATIPLQLLAYHLSDLKEFDVDKPRNLAKSVTVE